MGDNIKQLTISIGYADERQAMDLINTIIGLCKKTNLHSQAGKHGLTKCTIIDYDHHQSERHGCKVIYQHNIETGNDDVDDLKKRLEITPIEKVK